MASNSGDYDAMVTCDFEGEHTGDRDGRWDLGSGSWPPSFFPRFRRISGHGIGRA